MGQKMTIEERAALKRSKEIDKELLEHRKEMKKEVKLLLLGTGGSGKSTVAKQMHIIYLNGFKDKEREEYKNLIVVNLIENMQNLIDGARKLGFQLASKHDAIADEVLTWNVQDEANPFPFAKEHLDKLKTLWREEPAIEKAFDKQSEFQLSDSAKYFFDKMDSFDDMRVYKITEEDILRTRKKTTGVIETEFKVGDLKFRMVDVGGQRNERKKWIHSFQGVTAIIFVASLSEYDQVLEEEDQMNRMEESLNVFDEICNSEWFVNTPIILFLNKNDLLEEKIKTKDLGAYIPGYRGGADPEEARKFIRGLYAERNCSTDRDIYVHYTTATDTQCILMVFNALQNISLAEVFKDLDF